MPDQLSPDYVEHRQHTPPPTLTPERAEAYRKAEHCRALLQVVHQVCTQAGVPTDDPTGEPYTAAERVQRLQQLGTHPA
jgi:hypothetical protein